MLKALIFVVGVSVALGNSDFEEFDSKSAAAAQCGAQKDVDLSFFNLKVAEVRTLLADKLEKSAAEETFSSRDASANSIQTSVSESGMGVVRKTVHFPNKTRVLVKVMKTNKATGNFATDLTRTPENKVDASTSGNFDFGVDLQAFTKDTNVHRTVSGGSSLTVKSSTAFIQLGDTKVLQTNASASASTSVSSVDASGSGGKGRSFTAQATATSSADTFIFSKKCFISRVKFDFGIKVDGIRVTASIAGKGNGRVFTRVLVANKNGTSVIHSYAEFKIQTELDIQGKNKSLNKSFQGTQNITITAHTETIVRKVNGADENSGRVFVVSNEIKLRVGVQTVLDNGPKIVSSGGQILFRNSRFNIPVSASTFENKDNGDGSGIMTDSILTKQEQGDDVLVNNDFVNNVVSSAIN